MGKRLICEISKTPGKLQEKTVTASGNVTTVTPDKGFYGLKKVTVLGGGSPPEPGEGLCRITTDGGSIFIF